jgi:hypothetical protein
MPINDMEGIKPTAEERDKAAYKKRHDEDYGIVPELGEEGSKKTLSQMESERKEQFREETDLGYGNTKKNSHPIGENE